MMVPKSLSLVNKACAGRRWGFCAIYKHFPGFGATTFEIKMRHQIILSSVVILILSSCIPSTHIPENVMTISTVQALHPETPNAIEYIPDQVTDGKLLLFVESVSDSCYPLHTPISVNLIFRNLISEPIVLYDTFEIAINRSFRGGNISLLISDSNNNPVITLYDYSMADYWFGYITPTHRELSVNDEYQVQINFVIPTDRVLSVAQDGMEETTPISAGNYFVRFLYLGVAPEESPLWTGVIASNQIGVCLN